MGSPPPDNGPSVTPDAGFAPSQTVASVCGFAFSIPRLKLGLSIVLPFSPAIPFPHLALALTCDPNNPIKVDSGLSWGAGRTPNVDPDPDDDENAT
jgi:hypothetical protein